MKQVEVIDPVDTWMAHLGACATCWPLPLRTCDLGAVLREAALAHMPAHLQEHAR